MIQTHGFSPHQFLTSGIFTTPFAARAMASRGIIVAQIQGANNVGYEALDGVINKLSESSQAAIVDAHMAFGKNRLAAAEILDGVNLGYLQNVLDPLDDQSRYANGGTPFGGEGLKNWVARSALFNTDKMRTLLLVLAFRPGGIIEQWEEYSTLHQQHKPVDLIVLPPPREHPSTNPKNRVYCETFATDWFDFWLNGHEDPDPTKVEQYKRWRELKKLQSGNESVSN